MGRVTPRESYFRYWGKARPLEDGGDYHLLAYHCLDVAAAGNSLLFQRREIVAGMAEFLGADAGFLQHWLSFLLAIHDIGKFADGFQGLRPDLLTALQGRSPRTSYDERHDTMGYRIATGTQNRAGAVVNLFGGAGLSAVDLADRRELLVPWLNAATGHHGRPPALVGMPRPLSHQFPPAVAIDVDDYLRAVMALLLPDGPPVDLSDYALLRAFRRVSWLVAGFAVAADWIGSNEAWFGYRSEPMPLADYWSHHALPQAQKAVAESGLVAAAPAVWSGFGRLFPKIEAPTPLQRLADEIEISDYPQLFVVEEVTGGGKTEAAFALAHRLMDIRVADGIYFALPTMATANAMHRRVEEMYRRLFLDGTSPSLVLAHSASRMTLDLEEKNHPDQDPVLSEETASRQCSEWLSDSGKKALLAHVGVGTIDQALLAVLAARHQSMRLFGLCRKVMIVDEVHACDEYVHRLLCTLLRFHAALGGSAILLSATLPIRMRRELVQAFAQSIGVETGDSVTMAYPQVTHLAVDGVRVYPVAARESACRRISVRPLRSVDEVGAVLSQVVEAGGCACWVRNTVDDAMDAYREWVGRLGEERVILFHARLALGDRLRLESKVLDNFGPASGKEKRAGCLLIATQVVEQSLDLDFDAMVSDLAPIDLIIQRAGRLKRHARDSFGERVSGPDQRSPPELGHGNRSLGEMGPQ